MFSSVFSVNTGVKSWSLLCGLCVSAVTIPACTSSAPHAGSDFYAGNLTAARQQLRPAALKNTLDENSVLNNARLGMAALADGDTTEAKKALRTAYQVLESGNVNDEARLFASEVIWEGTKVYKGEPFEQALTYTALATTFALEGDWQNVRVASRATLRKLKDYSDARAGGNGSAELTQEELARRAAEAEAERARKASSNKGTYDYFKDEGRFVESDFALGYLLQGIADRVINEPSDALDAAVRANPRLAPLCDTIRAGSFNTVILVDYAHGPRKVNTGPDGALTDWIPRGDGSPSPLSITIDGAPFPGFSGPVCNVNQMAKDHRWNTFENARRAKSVIGDAMLIGGGITAAASDHRETQLIGLGVLLAGLALKSTAAADIRYNDLLPSAVYLAALEVPAGAELRINIPPSMNGAPAMSCVLPHFRLNQTSAPRVVYLRAVPGAPANSSLAARTLIFTNDVELPAVGDYPFILGGSCVAYPSDEVLRIYQQGGYLVGLSVTDLESLYADEGIHIGAGPPVDGQRRHSDNVHILEGGDALYTPAYATNGYKRLMYSTHAPWTPRSPRVRELAEQIRARNP